MGAAVVTTSASVRCPHGGTAILATANSRVKAGALVLVESDVHSIVGCGFYRGDSYSPCVTLEWQSPATRAQASRQSPVLTTSVGQCKNGQGAVQGVAMIIAAQNRGTAT